MSGTQISNNQFSHFPQRTGRNRSKDFCKRHEKERLFCPFLYLQSCMRGRKETVYQIVEKLQEMQSRMEELAERIKGEKPEVTTEEIRELQTSYEDMLKAILWILDGAKYLWQGNTNGKEKSPDSGNC